MVFAPGHAPWREWSLKLTCGASSLEKELVAANDGSIANFQARGWPVQSSDCYMLLAFTSIDTASLSSTLALEVISVVR